MNNKALLNEISLKSPSIGQELKDINAYILLDPEIAVAKARKTLELIVSQIESAQGESLYERIQAVSEISPESVIASMHFIRKLGNSAVHSSDKVSEQIAKNAQSVLTDVACWHLKIDPKRLTGFIARYFIADPIHRTWAKIVVLTEDGVLYSEYLTYMKSTIFSKAGFKFIGFSASDYSFGEQEHGNAYQSIREVDYQEATSYQLRAQENWVNRYLLDVCGKTDK